jgi:hypothetical protein
VHPKWHPRGRWLNFEDAAAVLSKAWCLHISMLSLLLCAATGLTPSERLAAPRHCACANRPSGER